MKWIPGGTFSMGSTDFYAEERPVHQAEVRGFLIDEHSVTGPNFEKLRSMVEGMTLNAEDRYELGPWLVVDAHRTPLGFAAAFALAHAAAVLGEGEIVDEWGHWYTGRTCAPESLLGVMTLPRRYDDLKTAADEWKCQLPRTCPTK